MPNRFIPTHTDFKHSPQDKKGEPSQPNVLPRSQEEIQIGVSLGPVIGYLHIQQEFRPAQIDRLIPKKIMPFQAWRVPGASVSYSISQLDVNFHSPLRSHNLHWILYPFRNKTGFSQRLFPERKAISNIRFRTLG